MNPDVYHRAAEIFLKASRLEQGPRTSFVDEACGSDADVRAAVQELLQHDAAPSELVESGSLGAGGVGGNANRLSMADGNCNFAHHGRLLFGATLSQGKWATGALTLVERGFLWDG